MGQKSRYIVGFFQNRQRSLPRCAARGVIGLIEDALEQGEEDTAEQPETEEPDEPDMDAEEE